VASLAAWLAAAVKEKRHEDLQVTIAGDSGPRLRRLARVRDCGCRGAPPQALASEPFSKVWTVALSQYNQADQTGESLTQLSNGTIVVGGNDSNQQNYCSTRKKPLYGGAWLVAAAPGSGSNVWQSLYSTCASAAQATDALAAIAGAAGSDGHVISHVPSHESRGRPLHPMRRPDIDRQKRRHGPSSCHG
jgi:hypothetical protein